MSILDRLRHSNPENRTSDKPYDVAPMAGETALHAIESPGTENPQHISGDTVKNDLVVDPRPQLQLPHYFPAGTAHHQSPVRPPSGDLRPLAHEGDKRGLMHNTDGTRRVPLMRNENPRST